MLLYSPTVYRTEKVGDLSECKTLLLGIGNTLLSDEGVGVHLVRYLEREFPGRAAWTCLDGGTLSFTLAAEVGRHPYLIALDAAATGGPPGTLRLFEGAEMDRYLSGGRRSVHEVGLCDLLDMARLAGDLPLRRALLGIEPASLGWGEDLTPAVAAVLPEAARQVVGLIARWEREAAHNN
jgi:hydrogenase maturation protease